ncbi:MAG: hypothetical protein IIA02_08280 [Proteobacteria bacterium]|nr:hypothetical protein [Pseudomonadota bacterium]
MAELILPKISPPEDEDRISYDEAKAAGLSVIGNGLLPKVDAIEPQLIPGMWHVEMKNHGLSIGAVADRFSSKHEAMCWAQREYPASGDRDRYGGYSAHCVYTPTEAELQLLDTAPNVLDLICYMVKITPVGGTASQAESFEYWASKKEALKRVGFLKAKGLGAKLHGRTVTFHTRTAEDLKNRAKILDSINGDIRKLRDGSVWNSPYWRAHRRASGARDDVLSESTSWHLNLYVAPQLRTFYSEFYSAKRILATRVLLDGFESEAQARSEGLRRMAGATGYSAMSVCRSESQLH